MKNQNAFDKTDLIMGIDARMLAASIVALIVTTIAAKATATYFDTPIMVYLLPPAILLGIILQKQKERWKLHTAVATALLIATTLISNILPDPTWDGNMYHKVATVALHDGWNPWRFPEIRDWMKGQTALEYSNIVWENNITDIWISNYPNASWLFGAAMLDYGFGWESSKAISLLLAIAVMLYSTSVFRQWLAPWWKCGLLSAGVVLCQPLLAQMATNYVDGMTYGVCALILLALLDRNRDSTARTLVWCSLILLAGLKFTGALYAALFAAPFLLKFRPKIREIAAWGTIGLFLLSHPYINHVASGLPIGYPVTSGDQILSGQVEDEMLEQSRPHSLLTSLFSKSANSFEIPEMKLPGTIHAGEIQISGSPDTRYSGFGPLFSLAALLGLIACLSATIEAWRTKTQRNTWELLACIAYVMLLTLIHAAPWWARYVPFLQFGLVIALLMGIRSHKNWTRGLALAGSTILVINGVLVSFGVSGYLGKFAVAQGTAIDRQVVHHHVRGESILIRTPLAFSFSAIYHTRENLKIENIEYEQTSLDQLNCGNREDYGTWIGLVKFCRGQATQ